MSKYAYWKPLFDGEAPPHWKCGMAWALEGEAPEKRTNEPSWIKDTTYTVPLDAARDRVPLDKLVAELARYEDYELAERGIFIGVFLGENG